VAFLYCCSGDHFDTATRLQKWQASSGLVVPVGKHGRGLSGSWSKSLATVRSRRCTMGMWFRDSAAMGPSYLPTTSSASGIQTHGDGSIAYQILDNALTSYFSPVDVWRPNTWHFLELDVYLDTTLDGSAGGFVKVYIDDPLHLSPIIDLEDIYTANATFATGDYLWQGCVFTSGTVFDDAYCLDGATTDVYGNTGAPVGPLGPISIGIRRPMDEGFKAEWDPDPAVPNWQNTDDDSPDGTTTNGASGSGSPSGIGLEDLHEMEDIDTDDTAIAMHLLVSARKDGEGTGQLTMLARHDGVTYDLETRNLAEEYLYRTRVALHTMPNGDPLTDANFNAMQFGYRREA